MDTVTLRIRTGGAFEDIGLPLDKASPAETLARLIFLSGRIPSPALCSGLGRCGRCRVRFLSDPPPALPGEMEVLSAHELERGWRLSCRRKAEAGLHLALADDFGSPLENARVRTRVDAGLALDLGTTSLHWKLEPEACPPVQGSEINPQMGAGSEVISRLSFALETAGLAKLQNLTLAALRRIAGQFEPAPHSMVLAANPAMVHILLGKNVAGLAHAPYKLEYAGGVWEELPGLPKTWIAPLISPFIGGDLSAGYAALAFDPLRAAPAYPFLLADLGTNGEMLLAISKDETLAASVALGPALEGINLSFGMEAARGAITGYKLTPDGLEPQVIGETAPKGITGTGYLALLEILRQTGLLSVEGSFSLPGRSAPRSPLAGRIGQAEASVNQEPRLRLPGRMYLAAADVEEILKTKAAFNLALAALLSAASMRPGKLSGIYLAGALGEHAPTAALEGLGFLPPGLGARTKAVGNTALAGAALFLRDTASREQSLAWRESVRTLNLAENPAFARSFAAHMRFSWENINA